MNKANSTYLISLARHYPYISTLPTYGITTTTKKTYRKTTTTNRKTTTTKTTMGIPSKRESTTFDLKTTFSVASECNH